jgi:hypothetical protein
MTSFILQTELSIFRLTIIASITPSFQDIDKYIYVTHCMQGIQATDEVNKRFQRRLSITCWQTETIPRRVPTWDLLTWISTPSSTVLQNWIEFCKKITTQSELSQRRATVIAMWLEQREPIFFITSMQVPLASIISAVSNSRQIISVQQTLLQILSQQTLNKIIKNVFLLSDELKCGICKTNANLFRRQ